MTRPLRSIVFDLDGTLIDSAPVFVRILNAMLAERASRRRVTIADVRPFASLGGPALVRGALAEDCGDLTRAVEDFRARYRLFPTPPESLYAGVADGVRALAALGFPLAICSNKPQTLCEKIIADLDLGDCFPVIVGSSPDRAMKPVPDLLDLALARLGSAVAECLYVGDSEVDLALARDDRRALRPPHLWLCERTAVRRATCGVRRLLRSGRVDHGKRRVSAGTRPGVAGPSRPCLLPPMSRPPCGEAHIASSSPARAGG